MLFFAQGGQMARREGRKNLKQMVASLSALGAGALLSAGSAQAEVVFSGPLNVDVGFGPNGVPIYNSGPLGPISSDFSFIRFSYSTGGQNYRGIIGAACG